MLKYGHYTLIITYEESKPITKSVGIFKILDCQFIYIRESQVDYLTRRLDFLALPLYILFLYASTQLF